MASDASVALFEMLAHLATNSTALSDFKDDPQDFMNNYQTSTGKSLTSAQKVLILSALNNDKHIDFHKAIGDAASDIGDIEDLAIC